jgi:hypothetical protein
MTIIEELEQQRKEAKVGLNGLTKIVKSMREEAAKARCAGLASSESATVRLKLFYTISIKSSSTLTLQPYTATNSTSSGAAQDLPIKKKRRAPVDSRRPSKQRKTGPNLGPL